MNKIAVPSKPIQTIFLKIALCECAKSENTHMKKEFKAEKGKSDYSNNIIDEKILTKVFCMLIEVLNDYVNSTKPLCTVREVLFFGIFFNIIK